MTPRRGQRAACSQCQRVSARWWAGAHAARTLHPPPLPRCSPFMALPNLCRSTEMDVTPAVMRWGGGGGGMVMQLVTTYTTVLSRGAQPRPQRPRCTATPHGDSGHGARPRRQRKGRTLHGHATQRQPRSTAIGDSDSRARCTATPCSDSDSDALHRLAKATAATVPRHTTQLQRRTLQCSAATAAHASPQRSDSDSDALHRNATQGSDRGARCIATRRQRQTLCRHAASPNTAHCTAWRTPQSHAAQTEGATA
jgi:hypothetical protein